MLFFIHWIVTHKYSVLPMIGTHGRKQRLCWWEQEGNLTISAKMENIQILELGSCLPQYVP